MVAVVTIGILIIMTDIGLVVAMMKVNGLIVTAQVTQGTVLKVKDIIANIAHH